ncbi:hypothetical protein [Aquimarina longa]|uniref:hypothetical protein n=1 Tax=Aquimarina longa TaxID=1080221 RepID=UPI000A45F524|nr:hypothetical protein [Aquimarina longa]
MKIYFKPKGVTSVPFIKDIEKNDTDRNIDISYIKKEVNILSNYRILILIEAMIILLGIYSFIAYSFLETSSSFF